MRNDQDFIESKDQPRDLEGWPLSLSSSSQVLRVLALLWLAALLLFLVWISIASNGFIHAWNTVLLPVVLFLLALLCFWLLGALFFARTRILALRLWVKGHRGAFAIALSSGTRARENVVEGLSVEASTRFALCMVVIADESGISFWAGDTKGPTKKLLWASVNEIAVGTTKAYWKPLPTLNLYLNGHEKPFWLYFYGRNPFGFLPLQTRGVRRLWKRFSKYAPERLLRNEVRVTEAQEADKGTGTSVRRKGPTGIHTSRKSSFARVLVWLLSSTVISWGALPLCIYATSGLGWIHGLGAEGNPASFWWQPQLISGYLGSIFGLLSAAVLLRSRLKIIWALIIAGVWSLVGFGFYIGMFASQLSPHFSTTANILSSFISSGIPVAIVIPPVALGLLIFRPIR